MRIVASGLIVLQLAVVPALAETGTIAVNAVHVREKPGKDGRIIGVLRKGAQVEFLPLLDKPSWVAVISARYQGVMIRYAIKPMSETPVRAVNLTLDVAPHVELQPEKERVIKIITAASPEGVRLQGLNDRLSARVVELETRIAELLPLKEIVKKLRQEIALKEAEVRRLRSMFPYVSVIEAVEGKGEDVIIPGIGKARLMRNGEDTIIRLENETISKGDKVLRRVAQERYETGGEATRTYYVVQNKFIKQG